MNVSQMDMESEHQMEIPEQEVVHNEQVRIPKMRKRISKIWNDFTYIPGDKLLKTQPKAICNYCKTTEFIAPSNYGTSNMKRHLKTCDEYLKQATKNSNHGKIDQQNYKKLVAKAIIRHGYPFSWVEHEGNRDIHQYLNDDFKAISRNTAKTECLKLHSHIKDMLKETLQTIAGRICSTCDLWSSRTSQGYLCLTAHYVDNQCMLNSKVLNFCHVPPPHNGISLYEKVYDLLKGWGIDNKIFSITLDNASSNERMQDYLCDQLHSQGTLVSGGEYFHIRCSAHILNLIVKEGLKVIDASISMIREIVKYIDGSEVRKIKFKECVERVGILEKKSLWLDVATRWNSTYKMLDRAILYRRAFDNLARCDSHYNYCLSWDEWIKVQKVHEILEPFNEITELFSGSEYPTANLYFENVWKIEMLLKYEMESEELSIRDMARNMKEKFDKYWRDYNVVLAFALILDPRYKLAFVRYCYNKLHNDDTQVRAKVNEVYTKLERLLKEYIGETTTSINATGISSAIAREGDTIASNLSMDFDQVSSIEKSLLDLYLDEPRIDRNVKIDVLGYWKDNHSHYKELASLAMNLLSIPITTVASESTFSIGGRILNRLRSRLLPENAEALVTTRSWLHGYEPYADDQIITGMELDWANVGSTYS